MPSLPLPLVHLVSLRSLLGRLGKTGVGTSHKPRRYFQSGHQHKYRGPGPGPSHPINIPGGSPPTPLRPPALAPGSSLLRVADTFTFFSQEPVSAAAMLRNPARPPRITSTVTSSPRHSASHQRWGVRFWGQGRRALVTPEFRLLDGYGLYGGDISTAAATRATGIVPNTNTTTSGGSTTLSVTDGCRE